ncbi:MAG: sulfatase-like hydrolase/transferase [Planctomycetes bacterium]|nr:sulfatase-like hydrolase/transferase [Planctomycetota bacterium]
MKKPSTGISRRQFLKAGAVGGAALITRSSPAQDAKPTHADTRPNILLVITDQQGLDTLSGLGCAGIKTPNMDRVARGGISFVQSHSTNPLCSPARSSIFTGRPTLETGVVVNDIPIRESVPNLGQWLGQNGYDPVYIGKWHIPHSFTFDIKGFNVIPAGLGGQGTLGDATISRAAEGYLLNRKHKKPFFLVASFLQPHDICQYVSMHKKAPDNLPYPSIANELPPLPPNFKFDKREPETIRKRRKLTWSEEQWRYYIWSYYRMVEEVDAEVGRVLDALQLAGEVDNTIVIFTADHGEGRGRHQMVVKNYLYEEALKVPLIVSCPTRMNKGIRDETHLVSGVDIVPTVCDYVGIKPPEGMRGKSLRPLLEGKATPWHEFVAAEVTLTGRMIRTPRYKYIMYKGDPVEQIFDMKEDPWETKNLAPDPAHADTLAAHRKLLAEWEGSLDVAPVSEKIQQRIDRWSKKKT